MQPPNNKNILYLLSWQDSIERLDIILLEIRNLQQSIIYSLHEPVLYLPLRYEEEFLWGEKLNSVLLDNNSHKINKSFLEEAIIPYPDPFKPINSENNSKNKDYDAVYERVFNKFKTFWFEGSLNRDQKRYYHLLNLTQTLKQQVFKDKYYICYYAIKYNIWENKINNDKPNFMILRRAVLKRAHHTVKRLEELKNLFSRTIDTGLQDQPRPIIERRKEIGLYIDFLSERTKEIQTNITVLLKDLGLVKENKEFINTILHGWSHSGSCEIHSVKDEINKTHIDYVSTHFWMPDRPDLQSVLAHEVGHSLVRDYLDDLSDKFFMDHANNSFIKLLGYMLSIIYDFYEHNLLTDTPENIIKEISIDLIALSIKGFAYLYAFFLEYIGFGLEKLLLSQGEEALPKLELIEDLEGRETPDRVYRREWYIRIKLMCVWLKEVHYYDISNDSIESKLLKGIDDLNEELLEYIDNYRSPTFTPIASHWQLLAKELTSLIKKSKVIDEIYQWGHKRSNDDTNTKTGKKGPRVMPRSMRRLHWLVRDYLFNIQLNISSFPTRVLSDFTQINREDINNFYGISQTFSYSVENPENIKKPNHPNPGPLYQHLYDIPWQSAAICATDILIKEPKNIIDFLHKNFVLGRERYKIALEFHTHDLDALRPRLIHLIYLIKNILEKYKNNTEKFIKDLNTWLGNNTDIKPLKINLKTISREDIDKPKFYQEIIWEYSAISISHCFSKLSPSIDSELYRKLEKITGYKIKSLFNMLENKDNDFFKTYKDIDLISLYHYLNIRPTIREDHDFYEKILKAITITKHKSLLFENNQRPYREIKTVMIGRICVAGSYDNLEENTLLINDVCNKSYKIKKDSKNYLICEDNDSHRNYFYNFSLLGRYDILTIGRINPLSRYDLPSFSDRTQNINDEKFPTFFNRREMSVQINLSQNNLVAIDEIDEIDENNIEGRPLIFILVHLQKRVFRLDFLYRLIKSVENAKNSTNNEKNLDEIGRYFHTTNEYGDYAYLMGGSGDFLLVLRETTQNLIDRIEDILKIKQAVVQDFMVDRIETIFTSSCIDEIANHIANGYETYTIYIRFRLMEDRVLEYTNEIFIDSMKTKFDHFEIYTKLKVEIIHLTGRMDFALRFTKSSKYQNTQIEKIDFFRELNMLLKGCYHFIDKIETSIGRIA